MKLRSVLLALAMMAFAASAFAGTITVDTWHEFSFTDVGTLAIGCFPDDPGGPFCISSGGTPISFADAPPWTFTAGASGATLTVTDAFESGDVFQILDFGVPAGVTSGFVPGTNCDDDPVPCLADAGMSHGMFVFGVGSHSITITPTASLGGGAGYFRLDGEAAEPSPVPEPATVSLVAVGLAAVVRRVRSNRS